MLNPLKFVTYMSCRWCSLFSEEDMSVLEYYLDLKTYWRRGQYLTGNSVLARR